MFSISDMFVCLFVCLSNGKGDAQNNQLSKYHPLACSGQGVFNEPQETCLEAEMELRELASLICDRTSGLRDEQLSSCPVLGLGG